MKVVKLAAFQGDMVLNNFLTTYMWVVAAALAQKAVGF